MKHRKMQSWHLRGGRFSPTLRRRNPVGGWSNDFAGAKIWVQPSPSERDLAGLADARLEELDRVVDRFGQLNRVEKQQGWALLK
jgi:hypothetical protein